MKRQNALSIVLFVLPFTTAFGAAAQFMLGYPGAPELCDGGENQWLASNNAYAVMSVVTPGTPMEVPNAVSAAMVAGAPRVKMSSLEAGSTSPTAERFCSIGC